MTLLVGWAKEYSLIDEGIQILVVKGVHHSCSFQEAL